MNPSCTNFCGGSVSSKSSIAHEGFFARAPGPREGVNVIFGDAARQVEAATMRRDHFVKCRDIVESPCIRASNYYLPASIFVVSLKIGVDQFFFPRRPTKPLPVSIFTRVPSEAVESRTFTFSPPDPKKTPTCRVRVASR